MQVTLLGTGTSQGVPIIGCKCAVCLSDDPKDKRLRTAALVQTDTLDVVIDIGPDFRQQMLRAEAPKLDAVLITHEHNDHVIGVDDVRPFNFRQKKDIPVYAREEVQSQLRLRFDYAFKENPYPGAPRLQLVDLFPAKSIRIGDLEILPIEVIHGTLPVFGFRIADFSYITDVNFISEDSWKLLYGTKILVLSALHHEVHHSHFNLTQALKIIERLQPEQAFLTHISHRMGKAADINAQLPPHVALAYDGQQIDC